VSPGLSTSDDTLPLISPGAPTTANTLAPSALNGSPSVAPTTSGGSFFGTRGIAIVLGLIFIFGAILLFTGEDIGGALARIAPAVA
jgi:hypothetical protein